jgi:SNW domain-containing protein 1
MKTQKIDFHDMKPEYVKYQPNVNAPGRNKQIEQRIVRIVEEQIDPLAPSKFRNKKAPAAPGSPPAPIMRSPPRKLTKEDQEIWKIPPCISNWKNPKGYVIPLDKRVGADGRGLRDVTVNDRFASLAEDLYVAEKKAREEIKIRNDLSKQQKARAEEQREQELRALAQQARVSRRNDSQNEEDSIHERARRELMRETLREHRMAKAGKNARDRDEDRDISEAVALGKQVQPSVRGGDSIYDARLFNQDGGGLSSGYAEEDISAYDKRLFADRSTAAGYKYDAQRVGAARQEMEDQESFSKDRKRPMLGKEHSVDIHGRSSLEFVTEDGNEEDDPFRMSDLLHKKHRH